MNPFVLEALAHFRGHWDVDIVGTSDAAQLLDIKPNTFKTRLARGQALVLRDPNSEQRTALRFTGYHLVYNLLLDRLLRYGLSVEHDKTTELAHVYAEWTFKNILSTPYHADAVVLFRKLSDGGCQDMVFENGSLEDLTGDAALIIPIGSIIVRLAAALYVRSAGSHREHINRLVEMKFAVQGN
ncbi:MAG TPA: hypothetical protein PKD49_05760 [Hyphomicrobium sp.]|nr:hypothetical protein [Hyphomicrobium sp.]